MASLEHVMGTRGQKRKGQDQTTLYMLQRPEMKKGNSRSLSAWKNLPDTAKDPVSLLVLYWSRAIN